jgi:hypothetical protein
MPSARERHKPGRHGPVAELAFAACEARLPRLSIWCVSPGNPPCPLSPLTTLSMLPAASRPLRFELSTPRK